MKAFVALIAAVLLATACSDPITRALKQEKVRLNREILDVRVEKAKILEEGKRTQNLFHEHLEKLQAAEPSVQNRGQILAIQTRAAETEKYEVSRVHSFDALVGQRLKGDRIFWVHSLVEATGWYVLVRGDQVMARTQTEYFIE